MANWGRTFGSAAGQIGGSLIPIPGASLAGSTVGGEVGNWIESLFNKPQQNKRIPMAQTGSPGSMVPQQPQGNWFSGYGGYQQQLPTRTPVQMSAMEQLLARGLAGSDFAPIEQRARSQFAQQAVPSLAERFTSLGGSGTRIGSNAFASQLGAASAGLEEALAALRSQYGLEQAQLGLQPAFENIYIPGREGIAQPLFGNISEGIGKAGTELFPIFIEWLKDYMKQPGQSSQISGLEPLPNVPTPQQSINSGVRSIQQSLGTRPYQL